jgi:hypothetical protein
MDKMECLQLGSIVEFLEKIRGREIKVRMAW